MVEYADREVYYDMDSGRIIDGDFDDDIAVYVEEDASVDGIYSQKPHFAYPDWYVLTKGRASTLIRYIRKHMEKTGEVEIWHISPDLGVPKPRISTKTVMLKDLRPEDLIYIDSRDVMREPVTQFRLIIKR